MLLFREYLRLNTSTVIIGVRTAMGHLRIIAAIIRFYLLN